MRINRVDFINAVHFAGNTVSSGGDKDCAIEVDTLAGASCVLIEHKMKKVLLAVPMANVRAFFFTATPTPAAQPAKK